MEEKSKSGEPIYRYPDKEIPWSIPEHGKLKEIQKFEKFITEKIGNFSIVFHEVISRSIHLDVYLVDPAEGRDYYTLVTSGMSYKSMNAPKNYSNYKYAELMISLPKNWKFDEESLKSENYYWPIYWLKFLARFVHDNNTWLAQGHTIPNGDPASPLAENTKLTGLLLLPSILFRPDARTCKVSLFKEIHLYALHPYMILRCSASWILVLVKF